MMSQQTMNLHEQMGYFRKELKPYLSRDFVRAKKQARHAKFESIVFIKKRIESFLNMVVLRDLNKTYNAIVEAIKDEIIILNDHVISKEGVVLDELLKVASGVRDKVEKMRIEESKKPILKNINETKNENENIKPIEPLIFENLSQKLLLFESLGVLKAISETTGENISSRKMGRIVADLLNANENTVTRSLRYFNPQSQPTDKNNPRNETNLTKLHSDLIKLKLTKLAESVEKQLREVMLATEK